jgi:hypothetical protein
VDEEVGPDLQGVLSDPLEIPEDRIGPVQAASRVAPGRPRDLESEVGVCPCGRTSSQGTPALPASLFA